MGKHTLSRARPPRSTPNLHRRGRASERVCLLIIIIIIIGVVGVVVGGGGSIPVTAAARLGMRAGNPDSNIYLLAGRPAEEGDDDADHDGNVGHIRMKEQAGEKVRGAGRVGRNNFRNHDCFVRIVSVSYRSPVRGDGRTRESGNRRQLHRKHCSVATTPGIERSRIRKSSAKLQIRFKPSSFRRLSNKHEVQQIAYRGLGHTVGGINR